MDCSMDRIPRPGELYRHFKNNLYQVIAIAVHSETGEQLVVYQAMYGSYGIYARPLAQFASEVDHKKYPNARQRYRFEKVERTENGVSMQQAASSGQMQAEQDVGTGTDHIVRRFPGEDVQQGQDVSGSIWQGVSGMGTTKDIADAENIRQQERNRRLLLRKNKEMDNGRRDAAADSIQYDTGSEDLKPEEKTPDFGHEKPGSGSFVLEENASVQPQKLSPRPRTQSPAESGRALRRAQEEALGEDSDYYKRRRRQMEEREQRRELFRRQERHESATEELRANPNLLKFLDTETYEEKFRVLNEIQNDITDRLIDDIAVVLDVVIPEGPLNDRFHQLRNIVLTRQKYEINRFRR